MHALVSDIDHYNEYVPWCTASRTLYRSPSVSATHTLTAELQVGFQAFSESYISTVTVTSPTSVRAVASDSAMFKTLINEWKFIPISQLHPHASKSSLSSDERSCIVDFYVAFEFRNAIYAQASKLFLDEVSKSMVTAFADRARVVYGSPARASIKLS
ncbi:hypothetical protein BATDEDRAFT_21169 [Batrachochytrium dendrobatidis JAM81]|uniref:Coenzyme Q-binding protein COQ10 START domain-containing protein n=1 Tax=Batrachochytrium dendrobatidis (strain JAM81 / FGSC 10211) TaxID=684364 RepID=F4NRE0_BATDJ|nr:uncharacterized protein BATDEDRAFT_21169 [Batrachochytrium dendrobatidis JAM81]EGF83737.1 hypothetical protein BATDEDRAFT_21169 [Batrachochytrium dendrobatidis JAM81]|eukprot:XP_006675214.1 hypothetical protein BATDEDRAFT_21169 [Batrachochytrium dendrobatidis JAM81]